MGDPTHITDHAVSAQRTTLTQFWESPKLQALLKAIVDEIQKAETVSWEVLTERLLAVAEGVNLDVIGRIVGFDRLDITDDDEYRDLLRVQIRANNSDCGAEDIIWVASELTGADVRYQQQGIAHFHLEYVLTIALTPGWRARVEKMIELITCSGVSWEMGEGNLPDVFRYNGGAGYNRGGYGHLVGQLP